MTTNEMVRQICDLRNLVTDLQARVRELEDRQAIRDETIITRGDLSTTYTVNAASVESWEWR